MNRALVFGVALFVALVGISLVGGDNNAVAGYGCNGCGGCHGGLFGGCHGGGGLFSGHGCNGGHGCHGGLFNRGCHGDHGCHGCHGGFLKGLFGCHGNSCHGCSGYDCCGHNHCCGHQDCCQPDCCQPAADCCHSAPVHGDLPPAEVGAPAPPSEVPPAPVQGVQRTPRSIKNVSFRR